MKTAVLGVLVVAAIAGYGVFSSVCPCARVPGGYLFGKTVHEPVSDWSFANDVPLCQLQVGSLLPHSINLNCMSSGGQLYVSCSSCAGKWWSKTVAANPRGRIRMNDSVYPVTVKRVEDAARLDEVWQARARKLGGDASAPRPDAWWTFHLESR